MEKLPRLGYDGQTAAELLACKHSHNIYSLMWEFEQGVRAKRDQHGHESLTNAEWLILAIMALNCEVNNGGYQQFFFNSSREFVPIVIDCLLRIQCHATAAITEKAIAALGLTELSGDTAREAIYMEDPVRDEILHYCDREFYKLVEIGPKLFSFLEAHQDEIHPIKPSAIARPKRVPGSSKIAPFRELVTDIAKQRANSGGGNPN